MRWSKQTLQSAIVVVAMVSASGLPERWADRVLDSEALCMGCQRGNAEVGLRRLAAWDVVVAMYLYRGSQSSALVSWRWKTLVSPPTLGAIIDHFRETACTKSFWLFSGTYSSAFVVHVEKLTHRTPKPGDVQMNLKVSQRRSRPFQRCPHPTLDLMHSNAVISRTRVRVRFKARARDWQTD